jgi:hypothetical protein
LGIVVWLGGIWDRSSFTIDVWLWLAMLDQLLDTAGVELGIIKVKSG